MSDTENNKILTITLDVFRTIRELWWRFVDWVALVSWPVLIITGVLVFVLLGPIGFSNVAAVFFWGSIATKILASGKYKAELTAKAATNRADVEALERRLLEAQMAALQAQIEPHFLFNTLALIGQLIETNPPQAANIHAALIQYLRAAMPQMREKGGGKLGQQVTLSLAYLKIMQARMGDRLTISVDLREQLSFVAFPSMMLQTLVENAIKQGLEPKLTGGHIAIKAYKIENDLQVDVSDNGIGFDLHADDGIGLSNIRERLKMLYGSKAQLIIEAPADGGTRVSIRLPYSDT